MPAHQGLHGVQAPAAQIEYGLVFQAQLVLFQGLSQVPHEGQAADAVLVLFGVVDDVVQVVLLGHVHGCVRVAHEQDVVAAVFRIEGDADAHAHLVGLFLEEEGLFHGRHDLAGEVHGVAAIGDAGQQDAELVAAEAGQGVGLAQDALDAGGDLLQQEIAVVVAQGVVDGLEAVQVDHEQGQQAVLALGAVDGLAQAVLQQHPVGEMGEGVVQGLVFQFLVVAHQLPAHEFEILLQAGDLTDGGVYFQGVVVVPGGDAAGSGAQALQGACDQGAEDGGGQQDGGDVGEHQVDAQPQGFLDLFRDRRLVVTQEQHTLLLLGGCQWHGDVIDRIPMLAEEEVFLEGCAIGIAPQILLRGGDAGVDVASGQQGVVDHVLHEGGVTCLGEGLGKQIGVQAHLIEEIGLQVLLHQIDHAAQEQGQENQIDGQTSEDDAPREGVEETVQCARPPHRTFPCQSSMRVVSLG